MAFLKSKYYDHPEGEDAFGKMISTNKFAACAGLTWSAYDVLMYSKTKGYGPTLARFLYNTGPLMGMASAFTMTTYLATSIRGKDDRFNYFLGGMAAGGVYGCWQRSIVSGMVVGLFLGIAGTVKKLSKQEGWEFFPEAKHQMGMINGVTHNYTLMAERPKGWTNVEINEHECECAKHK